MPHSSLGTLFGLISSMTSYDPKMSACTKLNIPHATCNIKEKKKLPSIKPQLCLAPHTSSCALLYRPGQGGWSSEQIQRVKKLSEMENVKINGI